MSFSSVPKHSVHKSKNAPFAVNCCSLYDLLSVILRYSVLQQVFINVMCDHKVDCFEVFYAVCMIILMWGAYESLRSGTRLKHLT